jgi:hypothetical protein
MQPDDNDESNVKDSILDQEEENVDEEANDTDVEMKEEETSAKAIDNEDIDQDNTIVTYLVQLQMRDAEKD